MNAVKTLLLCISIISLCGCEQDAAEKMPTPDVEEYIALLKSNQYNASNLPVFTSNDIEALLDYRNDTTTVNLFPVNPVSSYATIEPAYKLSILVLWTIESIRAVSCNSKDLTGRFPSLNPFLQTRDAPSEWLLDYKSEAYTILANVYFDWWESNKHNSFDDFKYTDPLETTNYSWH